MNIPYRILTVVDVLLLVTALNAQKIEPPFGANEIVSNVKQNHSFTESRQGEFLIDTNVVYGLEPGDQYFPSIAFDGANYLVVWQDDRNQENYADVYGTRVNQSGIVLDSAGFAISRAPLHQLHPAVAFDGTNYLVVWTDGCLSEDFNIYGTRVDQYGNVLDTSGIAISSAPNTQSYPSVAFDGQNYLVVWGDERDWDVYGTRVTRSGVVIDTAGINISNAAGFQGYPSIAFDGTNYLVVWWDLRSASSYDIYGARVTQSGIVLDSTGISISTAPNTQSYPSVAFDGTNYLVVWEDWRNDPNIDIYGARVNQSGLVLDPTGIPISTAGSSQLTPSVSFDSTNYLVVWHDNRGTSAEIYGARVSQSGTVLDPDGFVVSDAPYAQGNPRITSGDPHYLVVWDDGRNDPGLPDIYGSRVAQSGVVLDTTGIAISTNANRQSDPSVAFDGTNFLVAWQDGPGFYSFYCNYSDIYAARITQSGVVLDSVPIAISTADSAKQHVALAYNGAHYLAVWEDYRNWPINIYGARVNQAGIVIDTTGILISIAEGRHECPSVASGNTNYFVVWQNYHKYMNDIFGARVTQSGTVLDPNGIVVSTATNDQRHPSIAFDGTNYLVVWEDNRSGLSDIYGARVTESGVVLDPNGIGISIVIEDQKNPDVAFDGTNYIVVWEDSRSGYNDIYGARVTQTGVVLDPFGFPVATGTYNKYSPSITFGANDYIIVWQGNRSTPEYDIYAAKVSRDGVVVDSFPVCVQPDKQIQPALVHGLGDQILFAYSGWIDSISIHTVNTMRVWGKLYPFVGTEEDTEYSMQASKLNLCVCPSVFDDITYLKLQIPNTKLQTTLKIFDVAGRIVRDFNLQPEIDNLKSKIIWYGEDDSRTKLPAGIYFIQLKTDECSVTRKVVYLR